jgi:hypothetical protein
MGSLRCSIFDAGNLIASFGGEAEASAALERVATASAEARGGLLLVAFDDTGDVITECTPDEGLHSRLTG